MNKKTPVIINIVEQKISIVIKIKINRWKMNENECIIHFIDQYNFFRIILNTHASIIVIVTWDRSIKDSTRGMFIMVYEVSKVLGLLLFLLQYSKRRFMSANAS